MTEEQEEEQEEQENKRIRPRERALGQKKMQGKKMKNDLNALNDVEMNQNSDVKVHVL